jgi:integrase
MSIVGDAGRSNRGHQERSTIVGEVSNVYPVYALTVLFLAYTGLGAGELAGLNVGDLMLTTDATGERAGALRVERTRRKVKAPCRFQSSAPRSHASYNAPLFPHRRVGRHLLGSAGRARRG